MSGVRQFLAGVAAAAVIATGGGAPLNLVWFAGGGGSSEGMKQAGLEPDYALNHNHVALWMHEVNHPHCVHLTDDAHAQNPLTLEPGRSIASFWASPDCTHHSKARGGAPKSERIRGLAWCVIPWAKIRRPAVIYLENVEEFEDWGPLYPAGHAKAGKVIPDRKGETFRRFVRRLEQCGYWVEWRVLRAADYGAPTTRERLYLVARSDGGEITWPERTHAPRHEAAKLGLLPWAPAASILDWSQPCHSIFLTTAEGKAVGVKRPLVAATQRRIAKGVERYVVGAAEPFIVPITHAGERSPHGMGRPLPTVTAANRGEFAVAASYLVPRYGEREGQAPRTLSVEQPYPAVVPDGNGGGLAVAYISKFSENSIGTDPADPAHTIMAGATRHAVVAAYLGRQFGSTVSGRPLGEPHPAVMADGGGGKSQLVAVNLTSYYRVGVGSDAGDPVRSATGKDRHAITTAFLEQANTGMVGHEARRPVSTITGRATTQRLIETRLEAIGAPPGARRRAVLEFLWRHFGEPTEADWANPLGSHEARLRFGLVIIDGEAWEIADIGMRMLTARELFNAQGFPPSYIIDRDPFGRPISKTDATLMVGNSVSPPVARAIVAANLPASAPPERLAA